MSQFINARNISAPTKENLLSDIKPDMRLTMDFFKKVYGYELSYPGFAEQAINALEAVGCSHARQYYVDWVNEYETKRNAELKEVAHWYRLQCEKEWEKRLRGGEVKRTQQENLQQMSDSDLITLLENLIGVT